MGGTFAVHCATLLVWSANRAGLVSQSVNSGQEGDPPLIEWEGGCWEPTVDGSVGSTVKSWHPLELLRGPLSPKRSFPGVETHLPGWSLFFYCLSDHGLSLACFRPFFYAALTTWEGGGS